MTIEQALVRYLERYSDAQYQKTTQQWHQAVLRQFQQYLLTERHLCLAREITEADLHG